MGAVDEPPVGEEIAHAKRRVVARVDDLGPRLLAASHAIHARPELAYQEHHAAATLAALLEEEGLAVERGAFGLATAFVARAGSRGPNVVVCCEYDALPEIGHGCGHNVIGAAGVGAGLALAAVADDLGGRLTILGTPAEEGGGGKVRLLEAGAFTGADVAMMVHPEAGDVERVPYLATVKLDVQFRGRPSHASSQPHRGVNALDALVLGYSAVAALRQHIRSDEKVHGIITDGGQAVNVVPERAAATFQVRAPTQERLARLQRRVLACFEGAAMQTGAELAASWHGGYEDLVANQPLARAYRRNGEQLGREFVEPELIPASVAGSTDMGNVSKVVPTIHPVIGMVPLSVAGHTREFAEWAVSERGDAAVLDGAKALAMTGVDVWLRPGLLEEVRADFAERVQAGTTGLPPLP